MKRSRLREIILEELHAIISEMTPDAETEKRRSPIGKKVIDNIRKNNPEMENFERERLRRIDGTPEERNTGEF